MIPPVGGAVIVHPVLAPPSIELVAANVPPPAVVIDFITNQLPVTAPAVERVAPEPRDEHVMNRRTACVPVNVALVVIVIVAFGRPSPAVALTDNVPTVSAPVTRNQPAVVPPPTMETLL